MGNARMGIGATQRHTGRDKREQAPWTGGTGLLRTGRASRLASQGIRYGVQRAPPPSPS